IIWLIKRVTLPFVADQAKEALNFNITLAIVGAALFLVILLTFGIGLILAIPAGAVAAVGWLVFTVIAAIKASEGIAYRYPITLRLVKESGFPLRDVARDVDQRRRAVAERLHGGDGRLREFPQLSTRFVHAEDGGIGRFVVGGVLARRLADDGAVAFDVEDVVADLEGEADRVTV